MMNTYYIDVEKKVVKRVAVCALSLEEAKEKAVKKSMLKPDAYLDADVSVTAICKKFEPYTGAA